MGLYLRPGSPIVHIRYADQFGKIQRVSTGTTDRKLAKAILAKKKTEVAENRHMDVKRLPNTSFHELCDEYWELHGKKMQTRGIKYTFDTWKASFGNVPLREITQQKIERYLTERGEAKGWNVSSRNRYLIMLKALFNKAVEWGMLHSSPAAQIKMTRGQEARMRFLTAEEAQRLLDGASNRFRPLLVVALHTGMRKGEIFRLRWDDIDFQTGLVTVQKSKSGKRRSIPMDETVTAALRELPTRFTGGVVFPSQKTGEELTDISRMFPRLCAKAKLAGLHFHDLRHTFASHLVMKGVDIRTVQELLGHASLSMTQRYSHLAPEHRAKAVRVLDSAYDTKTDTLASGTNNATTSHLESVI